MPSIEEHQELEKEQKRQASEDAEPGSESTQSEEGTTGIPETTEGQKDLSRPSAEEIYKQVATNTRQELGRSTLALALSAYGGGVFMGLSALGTAIALFMLTTPGAPPHPARRVLLQDVLPPRLHRRHPRPLPALHRKHPLPRRPRPR